MNDDAQVQRSAAMPLYHQIFLALRDDIVSGTLEHGAPVPTEAEISERYGVSRITARRAMQELSDLGFVERRRRVGTRVIYQRPNGKPDDPARTIDSLIAFGRETKVQVVEYGVVPATPDVATALGLAAGEDVLRALRMRFHQTVPLGLIESVVPLAASAYVTEAKLRELPLLQILREAGEIIATGDQLISAVGAGPFLAAQLQLEPRAPVLRIERTLRGAQGKPLGRTVAHYRGDRYQLALDLEAVPHPILL